MNTAIQIVSVSHKPSITKIAEGVLLIAVAVLAANGIISFTAPSFIWKGEIPMFTPDLFDHPYDAPTAEDIVSGMETLNLVSMVAAVLVALYPVYHAIWCLCAGVGCNCKAPVFCGRMSRRFGSLSACSLLAVLAVCRGFECHIDGGATGDKPLMIVGLFLMVTSIALVFGCVLANIVKWYELKGPGRYRGDKALIAWFGRADALLDRASSNMLLLYGAELLACVASLIFGYGVACATAPIITTGLTAGVLCSLSSLSLSALVAFRLARRNKEEVCSRTRLASVPNVSARRLKLNKTVDWRQNVPGQRRQQLSHEH